MNNSLSKAADALRRVSWQRSVAASVALAISSVALAQSNAVGSIFGTSSEAGKVVITNTATGVTRSVTVEAGGRYAIPSLPIGTYKVELQKNDRTVEARDGVLVSIGGGSQVAFGEEALEEVVISGGKPLIDVSSTDTRSVFTAEELGKVSVKRNIEEVALLAPGAVRGDSRYNSNRGNPSASFGGSGANESAFYINGYAVTDPIKGLGSSSLPFEGIAQYQLLTGGYGAEFGRSTGGVVNIVTKSGTNTWVAGGQVSWQPSTLTADNPDIYYETNGTTRDGTLWNEGSSRETDSTIYSLYAGGPLIQDKLFLFVAGEYEDRTVKGAANFSGRGTAQTDGPNGWHDRDIDVPRWLIKVDYNFAEGQLLELTAISDIRKEVREQYSYYYAGGTPKATPDASLPFLTKGDVVNGGFNYEDGGELYVAKYTGAITDSLTFTALGGQQKNKHTIIPIGYDPIGTRVRDNRAGAPLFFGTPLTLTDPNAYDKSSGYRFDFEWIAGKHDIRIGYDVQNLAVQDGTTTTGPGYFWQYDTVGVLAANDPIPGAGGARGPGGNGDYVTRSVTSNGGIFTTDQFAYFLEDRWQIIDNVMLSLGIRNENFKNYNSDRVVFLDQTDQWAPRVGLSWDVKGDSSLRAFANAGRYHLAIPLNLAFRQVGGSTNTDEYYSFTGIDPATGVPTGLVALGNGPYSPNQEYGQARDPLAAAAQGLKPYFQDEFVLGFEANVFSGLKAGARLTYRSLKSQLDDNCDGRPAYNWAVANGKGSGLDAHNVIAPPADEDDDGPNGLDDRAEEYWTQLAQCRIINPGKANTIRFTDPVTGQPVLADITAEQWGLPKLKRIYKGVDLFLEHPFQNNWYGKIDYTLSKSTGNAEGMLYSDSGQADVAVTANWDSPELMAGSGGVLPNDRRHQIKALGFYQFSPEWRVSATLVSASGRPRTPIGFYGGEGLLDVAFIPGGVPAAETTATYIHDNYVAYNGPYYHYLNGELVPRGSYGRLPWTTVLDMGVTYAPDHYDNKLKLQLDVFNVLNTLEVQSRMDDAEAGPGTLYHSFNKALSYNAPRTVRFTVRYDWGGE